MNNRLSLSFEIPPSINNDYMKPRAIMKYGKPMAMMYESKVAKDFKKKFKSIVTKEVKKQNFIREDNKYVMIEWTFYFPRMNMDTNNYYKCPIDAITETKLVWEDDNISMNKDKNIYYDSKNPHVEIELYYLDKCGIFENENQLQEFIVNNCKNCKRGNKIGKKGGCSIYKKALENRIQEEIDLNELICFKRK